MNLSPLTQIEAQIGFYIGILIGVIGSGVFIIFFTQWEWYFKFTSFIGEVSIIALQVFAIKQLLQQRKAYLEAETAMKQIGGKQNGII